MQSLENLHARQCAIDRLIAQVVSDSENWFASLFFISFLVFSTYFITNLILATIYNNYKSQVDREAKERAAMTEQGTACAFQLLVGRNVNHIDLSVCVLLLKEMERPAFSVFKYQLHR
jgi:hypothetical protein